MSEPSESDLKTADELIERWAGRTAALSPRATDADLSQSIAQALAGRGDEERERAAKVAEQVADTHAKRADSEQPWRLDRCEAALQVAAAIRDGGRDGK